MEKHLKHIADEIKRIEDYASELQQEYYWGEYYAEIEAEVNKVIEYAAKHNVPIVVNALQIAEKYYEGPRDEDEYYEDESSYYDYYDEDESYYDYDESNYDYEDDEDYEDYEESSYY
jgi:hypothetical protein